MSRENVELVRSIYVPWERGDFHSVKWAHPEIEFVIADFGPLVGSTKGLAGMSETWRTFLGAWAEYRCEVDECRELDDERVLVLLHIIGRGKSSGVELGQVRTKAANLFTSAAAGSRDSLSGRTRSAASPSSGCRSASSCG